MDTAVLISNTKIPTPISFPTYHPHTKIIIAPVNSGDDQEKEIFSSISEKGVQRVLPDIPCFYHDLSPDGKQITIGVKREAYVLDFQNLPDVKDYRREAKFILEGHLEDILEVAYSPGIFFFFERSPWTRGNYKSWLLAWNIWDCDVRGNFFFCPGENYIDWIW